MIITPAQTCGPLFGFAMTPAPVVQAVDENDPEAILVEGSILDGAGEGVGYGAFVEMWGSNQTVRARALDGHFRTFIRKPEPLVLADGQAAAPHLDVRLVMRGLALPLLTKMYFPDEAEANAVDPIYTSVPEEHRPRLVALPGDSPRHFVFNVHLQGEDEAVFFTAD